MKLYLVWVRWCGVLNIPKEDNVWTNVGKGWGFPGFPSREAAEERLKEFLSEYRPGVWETHISEIELPE